MSMLLCELKERLKGLDEISLLELLELTSDDIVEAFEIYIEEHYDKLRKELDD